MDGVLAPFGFQHGVALLVEHVPDEGTNAIFIFEEQNGFGPTIAGEDAFLPANGFGLGVYSRQINLECCAMAGFAVDPDISSALFHDAVCGREPEACAFSGFLGCEERFEDPQAGGLVHSYSVVTYREHNVLTGMHFGMFANLDGIEFDIDGLDG